MTRRTNPHELARDPAFRPPLSATEQAPHLDAGRGGSVACRRCGSDQIIPIPVWDLIGESDEDTGVLDVPVALVCLDCYNQAVYTAKWRPEESDG